MLRWLDRLDDVVLGPFQRRHDARRRRKHLPRFAARCQHLMEPGEQIRQAFVGFFNRTSFERPRLVVVTDRRIVVLEVTTFMPIRPRKIVWILPRATRLGPLDRGGFISIEGRSMWIPEAEDRREVERADADLEDYLKSHPPPEAAPPWH